MKVEYKVREVTRYIITRYEQDGKCGSSTTHGEFDNLENAKNSAHALFNLDKERFGHIEGAEILYEEPDFNTD